MPDLPFSRCRVHAALLLGLAAAHAHAQTAAPNRAVMEPLSGLQVSYQRMGPDDSTSPPGNFEGSLATPAGTLKTTVHAVPLGEQQFQRGDTSFDWAHRVFGGQVQMRELQSGGTAAAWRGQLDPSLTAETESQWSPVRSGQALRLNQSLGEGRIAKASLSSSKTTAGQGARGDFEFTQDLGMSRWNAGVDASDSYVPTGGSPDSGVGVRVGAQWLFLPHSRLEARYNRKLRGDAEEAPSTVFLGTRFDLPRGLSFVTGLESDAKDRKASMKLAVPLEIR